MLFNKFNKFTKLSYYNELRSKCRLQCIFKIGFLIQFCNTKLFYCHTTPFSRTGVYMEPFITASIQGFRVDTLGPDEFPLSHFCSPYYGGGPMIGARTVQASAVEQTKRGNQESQLHPLPHSSFLRLVAHNLSHNLSLGV